MRVSSTWWKQALKHCPPGSTEVRWNYIHNTVYTTTMTTFGKRVRWNPNWFEAWIDQMEPVLAGKWKAILNYKQKPSGVTLLSLRKIRKAAQHQWLPPESVLEYLTKESVWPQHHQNGTPQVCHWLCHNWLQQTDREVSRTLPGVLFNRKCSHWDSNWMHVLTPYHGWAGCTTHCRRAWQSHQLFSLW